MLAAVNCENLGEGLRGIGRKAFKRCTSLHEISIHPAVKVIKGRAFYRCSQLSAVNLGKGLREIGKKVFGRCRSLRRKVIPPDVIVIHDEAFYRCSNLTSVVFCDDIEQFVSTESIWEWWDQGIREKSLSTYSSFV